MTTGQDEVISRVTSYITHQAGKEPAAIRSLLEKAHGQLLAQLDGVSEEQARFKPGPEDWSVMEVLQHAAPTKLFVAKLCAALARGETPEGGRDGDETYESLGEARAGLDAAQEELLAFVDGLSPEANTEAKFNHFLFGDLNCREWAAFQRVHDADHAQQIEQIKAAPGYPA